MNIIRNIAAAILILAAFGTLSAQTTAFTYQGSLNFSGQPANGNFDFEFALFDAVAAGTQLGSTQTVSSVAVTNGNFAVTLDFGSQFPGAGRFLEIRVRPAGQPGITILSPRQQISSTPYSVKSVSADTAQTAVSATNANNAVNATNATTAATATNALSLGGVAANQYVLTGDARLSDARNPLPGSTNYIQNTATQQASSNFNISGNGTAAGTLTGNIITATTQFNIGNDRILAAPGDSNIFVGVGAGQSATGSRNSFFGRDAGLNNTTGNNNSLFGFGAGTNNSTGTSNSFFGTLAGAGNTTGGGNSFFGFGAGFENTSGTENSFFGVSAGGNNTIGLSNSFFGYRSGLFNTTGSSNAFFGLEAGLDNTTGSFNSFVGKYAGWNNTSGTGNVFVGSFAGNSNSIGNDIVLVGWNSDVGSPSLNNATAIGSRATVTQSNSLILGAINGVNGAAENTNVGIGTTAPTARLQIVDSDNTTSPDIAQFFAQNQTQGVGIGFNRIEAVGSNPDQDLFIIPKGTGEVQVSGLFRVTTLGSAGSTQLCRNASNQIATCSSSLRYKKNITPFAPGLSFVRQLRPISYEWTADGNKDVGFGAEDVAKIDPRFVTYNDKGEVEGIKYDRLSVAFVNAFREQQAQIETQRAEIEAQRSEIDTLKQYICIRDAKAPFCKEKK